MVQCHAGATSFVEAAPQGDRSGATPGADDDRLVERSRRGDLEAFDRLVASYYASVFAVARRLSPSPDDAADVVQEVFLAAWRQIGRFNRRASFRTWLHAIALRQCALSTRSARRRPPSLDDPSTPAPAAPGEPVHTLYERRAQEQALHAAIHALPRAQREAVVLHYFAGLTCAEAAAAMGISSGSVMTHLFRARLRLRELLGDL